MTIEYNWKIVSLKTHQLDDKSDVVTEVHWRFEGTDGVNSEGISGATVLEFDESSKFVPYDKLSPNNVEQWVLDAIGTKALDEYKAELSKRLKEYSSTSVNTLPWIASQNVEPQ